MLYRASHRPCPLRHIWEQCRDLQESFRTYTDPAKTAHLGIKLPPLDRISLSEHEAGVARRAVETQSPVKSAKDARADIVDLSSHWQESFPSSAPILMLQALTHHNASPRFLGIKVFKCLLLRHPA